MKCVKNQHGEIKRVQDDVAETMVAEGWAYCPKSEWKEKVRDKK